MNRSPVPGLNELMIVNPGKRDLKMSNYNGFGATGPAGQGSKHYCPVCGVHRLGAANDHVDEELGEEYVDDMGEYDVDDGYGEIPDEPVGYYGPYREDLGYYGYEPDDIGGYVRDLRPPFNARGDFGTQLSGYQAERTTDPTCSMTEQTPTTPPAAVPDIFKPYV